MQRIAFAMRRTGSPTGHPMHTHTHRRQDLVRPRRNRKLTIMAGVVEQSEIIGRGMMLFVALAASLNWMYYRNIRLTIKKQKQKEKENDTKL